MPAVERFAHAGAMMVVEREGHGRPVYVLVHGIGMGRSVFADLIRHLHDGEVVAVDLPGYGEAPEPARVLTMERTADLVAAYVRAHVDCPVVLVGHSMGALIAARYGAAFPRDVSRVVLVSPPIYLTPSAIGDPLDRAAMELYLRAYGFLRENKEFTIRAAGQLARLSPIRDLLDVSDGNWRAFVLSLQRSIESQTTVSDLVEIRVPIEIVYGTLDPFLAPAGIRIAERLRGVTSHRVVGGDHVIRRRMARVVATAVG